MRRKLSHTEHVVEGNIVYLVRLEGSFSLDQFRSALSRVQRRHPALRALIREEPGGLYYEADSAPEIPLRIVPRVTEDDYRRECQAELAAIFAYGQPQLRAVWLRSELESDLLLTTSHRICDGMSMLTIVREVLRSLHTDEALIPYQPITQRDIIGDYQPPHPWKRKLLAGLMNGMLRLIPSSRRAPENNEHYLEWRAGRALLNALKQRCNAEGVSVHAALLLALDRALFAVFGKEKMPKWRGRFAALKSDMVFFCGGNFKVRTGQAPELEFWAGVRRVHEEIRREVEQEILDIPSRFQFSEMLRPVTRGQIQSIVRLGDALKMNGSWNRFAFSNLGNVVISDSDAPFRVKDLRLYMHSVNVRVLCLVTYTLNDEMCFYCVKREFMALLQNQVLQADDGASQVSRMPAAVAE